MCVTLLNVLLRQTTLSLPLFVFEKKSLFFEIYYGVRSYVADY